MIEIKISKGKALLRLYREMSRRVEDWQPIKAQVKRVLIDAHRRRFRSHPVGPMRNLGPSILKASVFSVSKDKIEFGTDVKYAMYYDPWRRAVLGEPLLGLDETGEQELGELVTEYIVGTGTLAARGGSMPGGML